MVGCLDFLRQGHNGSILLMFYATQRGKAGFADDTFLLRSKSVSG